MIFPIVLLEVFKVEIVQKQIWKQWCSECTQISILDEFETFISLLICNCAAKAVCVNLYLVNQHCKYTVPKNVRIVCTVYVAVKLQPWLSVSAKHLFMTFKTLTPQWRIQDFSKWGGAVLYGGAHILFSGKKCMKLKEIGLKWGGARLLAPCYSKITIFLWIILNSWKQVILHIWGYFGTYCIK